MSGIKLTICSVLVLSLIIDGVVCRVLYSTPGGLDLKESAAYPAVYVDEMSPNLDARLVAALNDQVPVFRPQKRAYMRLGKRAMMRLGKRGGLGLMEKRARLRLG